ncbi:hypothetical protein CHKEEEPN_0959 [Methylorubrum podarium]|nr:hypothetical protein CHKEEEPN_0959 [Methylorubrum podarium]
MQGEGEVLHLLRGQQHLGTRDRDALRRGAGIGRELRVHEGADLDGVVAGPAEQGLGPAQCVQPGGEILHRRPLPDGAGRERGDDAKEVARAVLQLLDEHVLALGGPLGIGDVGGDAADAVHLPLVVEQREVGVGEPALLAVARPADAEDVGHPLARPHAAEGLEHGLAVRPRDELQPGSQRILAGIVEGGAVQHLEGRARILEAQGPRVPDPEHVRGRVRELAEPRLALPQGRLGLFARGDVDEGDDDARDEVVDAAIRQDADHVARPRLRVLDLALGAVEGAQDAAGVVLQLLVGDAGLDVGEGTAGIRFDEVEQLRRGRREAHDAQVVVEEDGGDLRAFEEVLEVAVDAAEFLHPQPELAVDGGQLLVDRLQLLLRSLQLLVGRLQLLVQRLVLLVRGLQLLVGALRLLGDGLQPVLVLAQLRFELPDAVALVLGRGRRVRVGGGRPAVLEQHEEVPAGAGRVLHRLDHELDQQALPVLLDPPVGEVDRPPVLGRAHQRRAQVEAQVRMRQLHQVERGGAPGRIDVAPGPPGEVQHRVGLVHDHVGRRVAFHEALGPLRQRGLDRADGQPRGRPVLEPRRGHGEGEVGQDPAVRLQPAEDARARLDRAEQVGVPGDVLGIAEEQHALRLQREVEDRDDAALQLGVEIDQQVAAGDEVEAGEGRILDDAVLGEDAHLPHFLDDAVGVALPHEPAREPLGADVAHDRLGVAGRARRREGPAVEVGREDLDLRHLFERRHVLAQQDAEGVGLLAG